MARLADRTSIASYAAADSRELPAKLLAEKHEKVLRSGRIGEHTRLTITDREVGSIHYDSDPVCLYLVICSREYQQRTAFKLLGEVRREFEDKFSEQVSSARHSELSRAARDMLSGVCERYNVVENVDKVAAVKVQVEEVKGVMQGNIESVLRNQENIETLLDESDAMKNEATGFQRSANRAKDKMWWKNAKMQMAILALVIVLIILIIGAATNWFKG